jgi:hypothetical protein
MRTGQRLIGAALLLGCAACSGPKAYVRPGFLDRPPQRVAVLPFVITYAYDAVGEPLPPEAHTVGRDLFRKAFVQAFAPYGYDDVGLQEVDELIAGAWGPPAEGAWRERSPQLIGELLGADALIYGDLNRLMHFSTPLYTETSLSGTLRMVDAKTGEELWRQRVKAAERGGAALQKGQVVDFLQDQVRSFHADVKFQRVADLAVKQALRGMPNPTLSADTPLPPRRAAADAAVRLAILPLQAGKPKWRKGAEFLRTQLAAGLQESPFEVVEPQRVDAGLKGFGWAEGLPLPEEQQLKELGHALGVDVWLRGTLTQWGRSYWLVQSWVRAAVAVELVDAQTQEVVWSATKRNSRGAGVLKGPTGYKSLVTAPITGLKTSHLERVGTHLARAVAEEIASSPTVLAYLDEVVRR